ncbi:UNVERIFIED_CONTAM: two-component system alkaline phosphatase synthesis response regulator PhoP [Acetivibrio alkalicellulosi]
MRKHNTDKILLIDPDKVLTDELSDRLSGVGLDMLCANDEITAQNLIDIGNPSLIILELSMKGLDGKDFISKLNHKKSYSGIPLIVLSSFSDVNSKVYAFLHGANDYITKPFEFPELLARINIQRKQIQAQLELKFIIEELTEKNLILEQTAFSQSPQILN